MDVAPIFERVRFDHDFADFRHLATGRHVSMERLTFGSLAVTVWREYRDGEGWHPLVAVDMPEAAAADPLTLLMVPNALALQAALLAGWTPEEAARYLWPELVPAEDPDRQDGMWRFHLPKYPDALWRIRTAKGPSAPAEG